MSRGVPKSGFNSGWFKKGHAQVKTESHRRKIGEGQKRAWATKRQRKPIGARYLDGDGYIRVKIVPGKGVWKLEHIIVAEKMIGRHLFIGEIVHHINGDRSDNRPENLFICSSRSKHNDVHRTQDIAFRKLLEAGKVVFKNGVYEAVL